MQQSPLSLIHERPPFSWYRSMRETAPISYMPQYQAWGVFGYDDVRRVLSDPTTFSSSKGARKSSLSSLSTTDPPRHSQLRGLVNQAFTPRSIAELAPRIAAITQKLLDAISEQGQMDVVDDLAYLLPVTVISELVGVPQQDRQQLRHWIDEFTLSMRGVQLPGLPPVMTEYFTKLGELRRQEPQDDLISRLVVAQIDGQSLSSQELADFCFLVYGAGHSTTTDLIGNTVLCLLQHPELQEELHSSPERIPDALEEVLRYNPPVHSASRAIMTDVTLGNQLLQEGQGVICWVASANHDPGHFPEPERFDIQRSPNRHLSFGFSTHFCLGAPLARLEAQIALETLLARFSELRLMPGVQLEARQNFVIPGMKHIPITFRVR